MLKVILSMFTFAYPVHLYVDRTVLYILIIHYNYTVFTEYLITDSNNNNYYAWYQFTSKKKMTCTHSSMQCMTIILTLI